MSPSSELNRFLKAQESTWQEALTEIKNGEKQSHWMWFIFPQIAGLGFSEFSRFYAIRDLEEAEKYLAHPVLGKRLIEISEALLKIENLTAREIFGSPDDMKLQSSMTLFNSVPETHTVFQQVLDKYFFGKADSKTLQVLI